MQKDEMVKIENDLCAKRFLHCKRAQRLLKDWAEVTKRDLGEDNRYCHLCYIRNRNFYLDRGYSGIYYVSVEDEFGENERSLRFGCPVDGKDFDIDINELLKRIYNSGTRYVGNYYTNLKA